MSYLPANASLRVDPSTVHRFVEPLSGIFTTRADGSKGARWRQTLAAAEGIPPYHVSCGGGAPGGVIVFFYGGDWKEFGSEAVLAWAPARRAILDYFETGRLSSVVKWAEV